MEAALLHAMNDPTPTSAPPGNDQNPSERDPALDRGEASEVQNPPEEQSQSVEAQAEAEARLRAEQYAQLEKVVTAAETAGICDTKEIDEVTLNANTRKPVRELKTAYAVTLDALKTAADPEEKQHLLLEQAEIQTELTVTVTVFLFKKEKERHASLNARMRNLVAARELHDNQLVGLKQLYALQPQLDILRNQTQEVFKQYKRAHGESVLNNWLYGLNDDAYTYLDLIAQKDQLQDRNKPQEDKVVHWMDALYRKLSLLVEDQELSALENKRVVPAGPQAEFSSKTAPDEGTPQDLRPETSDMITESFERVIEEQSPEVIDRLLRLSQRWRELVKKIAQMTPEQQEDLASRGTELRTRFMSHYLGERVAAILLGEQEKAEQQSIVSVAFADTAREGSRPLAEILHEEVQKILEDSRGEKLTEIHKAVLYILLSGTAPDVYKDVTQLGVQKSDIQNAMGELNAELEKFELHIISDPSGVRIGPIPETMRVQQQYENGFLESRDTTALERQFSAQLNRINEEYAAALAEIAKTSSSPSDSEREFKIMRIKQAEVFSLTIQTLWKLYPQAIEKNASQNDKREFSSILQKFQELFRQYLSISETEARTLFKGVFRELAVQQALVHFCAQQPRYVVRHSEIESDLQSGQDIRLGLFDGSSYASIQVKGLDLPGYIEGDPIFSKSELDRLDLRAAAERRNSRMATAGGTLQPNDAREAMLRHLINKKDSAVASIQRNRETKSRAFLVVVPDQAYDPQTAYPTEQFITQITARFDAFTRPVRK